MLSLYTDRGGRTTSFIVVLHANRGGRTTTFIVVFSGHENQGVCTTFKAVPILIVGTFSEAEVKHEKRDKLYLLLAKIFLSISLTVKAFIRNKKKFSNWFSPRVVGGFSRVKLTKIQRVKFFCVVDLFF